uniref:Uncharacterized protein n=1 Tax=Arundo donax TaxID=35708 RepID=A0A0A9EHH6_ARUDO
MSDWYSWLPVPASRASSPSAKQCARRCAASPLGEECRLTCISSSCAPRRSSVATACAHRSSSVCRSTVSSLLSPVRLRRRGFFPVAFSPSPSAETLRCCTPFMQMSCSWSIISSNISRAAASSVSGIISLLGLRPSASRSSPPCLFLRPLNTPSTTL